MGRLCTFLSMILVLVALSAAASEPGPPSADRDEVIRQILGEFWGNARDVRGMPIQPENELDRRTVPVSRGAANRAIEAGNISAVAEWCGLEWEPHYFALTRSARARGMVDKQVAFLSVLHGAGQAAYLSSLDGRTCTDEERGRVTRLRDESAAQGLPDDANSTW